MVFSAFASSLQRRLLEPKKSLFGRSMRRFYLVTETRLKKRHVLFVRSAEKSCELWLVFGTDLFMSGQNLSTPVDYYKEGNHPKKKGSEF